MSLTAIGSNCTDYYANLENGRACMELFLRHPLSIRRYYRQFGY